uniref:Uncharacterized protein n=1 Tax=Cannabis sativa TaxID=3483 RepID=A0A803QZ76_CANSA
MASVRFRFEACLGVSFLKYSIVVWKIETVNWQRKLQLLDSLWQYLTFSRKILMFLQMLIDI